MLRVEKKLIRFSRYTWQRLIAELQSPRKSHLISHSLPGFVRKRNKGNNLAAGHDKGYYDFAVLPTEGISPRATETARTDGWKK